MTHVSTVLSLICCLIMSIAGYLSFTDKTEVSFRTASLGFCGLISVAWQGNILNNFPAVSTPESSGDDEY